MQDFCLRLQSQRDARQRVVRQSVRELGDDVRGRGRDEQQVGIVRQFDVRGLPAFLLVVEISHDGMPRHGLEGQRRDEPQRVRRHGDMDAATGLGQQAGEVNGLVRGDGTGHAEHDVFSRVHVSFCSFSYGQAVITQAAGAAVSAAARPTAVPAVEPAGGTPTGRKAAETAAPLPRPARSKLRHLGPALPHLLRVHHGQHPAQVFLDAGADDQIVEVLPLRDLLPRHAQALLNRDGGKSCPRFLEPLLQDLESRPG